MSITDDLEPGIESMRKRVFSETANLKSEFQSIVYAFLIEKQHVTVVKSNSEMFMFTVESTTGMLITDKYKNYSIRIRAYPLLPTVFRHCCKIV